MARAKRNTKKVKKTEIVKETEVSKEIEAPEVEELKNKVDLSDTSVDISDIQNKIVLEEKTIARSNKVEINGKKFIITPDGQMIDEIEWKSITGRNI